MNEFNAATKVCETGRDWRERRPRLRRRLRCLSRRHGGVCGRATGVILWSRCRRCASHRVQPAAPSDLHVRPQQRVHRLGKRTAHIGAVGQHTFSHGPASPCFAPAPAARPCGQSPSAVVTTTACGKPPCIDRDVPLAPRDLFAGGIAFPASRVRVLHALRVHGQKPRAGVAPLFHAGHANLIF